MGYGTQSITTALDRSKVDEISSDIWLGRTNTRLPIVCSSQQPVQILCFAHFFTYRCAPRDDKAQEVLNREKQHLEMGSISPDFSSRVGGGCTTLAYVYFTLRLECVTLQNRDGKKQVMVPWLKKVCSRKCSKPTALGGIGSP